MMFVRPDSEISHHYAESELLEAIRGEEPAGDFTVTITRKGGTWVVSGSDPHDAASRTTGTGATFAEAWLTQAAGAVAVVGGH